jgi:hypothetical protein
MGGFGGLIIGIALGVWVFQFLKGKNVDYPWAWGIGTAVLPAIFLTIVGFKYDNMAMKIVGCILLLILVGAVGYLVTM